ncbi:restriction endonuclease subunit S [Ruminococcus sp. TM463]|uniref:restriction endonuclease subunit S n=1 Tax=unclassified Ruminococcus TaxID=2608920 RepID=UPI002238C127|nr:restriction endonuclease subunit S [Ruminococcus sp. TM463]MCB7525392.1 restriction endonuclease subunit S [Ruminococcus sp. TM463]
MKCIEDEIPFELPEGWEWTRLQAICEPITDGTHKTPTYSDEGFIFLSSKNVTSGHIDWDNIMYIPESLHNELYARLAPQKNDILLAKNGTTGVAAIVDRDCIFDIYVSLALLRIIGYIISPEYLLSTIASSTIQNYFNSSLKGIGVPNLHLEHIRTTLIPVAPINEQYRIATKLEQLLSFADNIESDKTDLQTTIQLTKSKILDLAIRGKLVKQNPDDEPASVLLDRIRAEKEELIKQGKIKRDKKESVIFRGEDNSYYEKIGDTVTCIDEELPFELPDGWIWCRGSSCFLPMESRKPSGTYFKYIDIDSIDNKHQAIKKAKITETAKAPSRANRAVFDGSILFSLVRPYLKNIALVDSNNADSIVSTGFYIATSNGTFIPKYLYILMISAYVVNGLNQFMKGDNSPSISKDNIEKWLYPVPPLAEQEKIADIVQKYIRILEDIEKSLS